MAFKMNVAGPNVRVGIDKQDKFHIEIWPMENGWNRDIDPALSSGDPEEIILTRKDVLQISAFLNSNEGKA